MSNVGSGWDMPAGTDAWHDFTWFKVSSSRILVMVLLTDEPIWYAGHFHKGRMRPCNGDDCEYCAKGIGKQLRYIIAGWEVSAGTVGLLELGRSVALELRDLGIRYNKFRGLVVEIGKVSHAKQSRMTVSAHPGHEYVGWSGAEVPDIKTALRNTWLKAGELLPPGFEAEPKPQFPKGLRQQPMDDRDTQEPRKEASGVKNNKQAARPTFHPPKAVR